MSKRLTRGEAMRAANRSWWQRFTARLLPGGRAASIASTSPRAKALLAEPELPPNRAGETLSPVDAMLAQKRYCLLLRPRLAGNLSRAQFALAREALEESMATIPAGPVDLGTRDSENISHFTRIEQIDALLLDRYPVTNREYRQFVESGGYEIAALWEAPALAALADFVDQSGAAGPRWWRNSRYPAGEDEHPVVGVSWYEASAYARWVGKRLPSDGEWVKAAAWPIPLSDGQVAQRRFPWGDALDRGRTNVWGSGPGKTVAVNQYVTGVSVGGVYQLIGNVWEWTGGDFEPLDEDGEPLELAAPMKCIRGGAFNTYFEQQICSHFASGESPLGRKNNIGFRCALSVCDVAARHARLARSEEAHDKINSATA